MLIGAVYIAPFLHYNYSYVLPYIGGLGPGTSLEIVALKKITFDQLVLAPTCFFFFYLFANKLEGRNMKETREQIEAKFWPTMYANWKVWPFVNFVNFYLIPMRYQVLWNSFFSMFFNAYLSFMHHRGID